jgi:hypothetical protein
VSAPRRTSLTATVPRRTLRGRAPKTATTQAAPMASIGAPSLNIAGAPDDLLSLSVGSIACEERFSWNEVGARVRRAPWRARLRVTGRRLLALTRSCGTPWNSADNANAFTQSQLATARLVGAISSPNLFHPWRRGHRRTRLRCRHPRRPRTRRRRPASQSCGSSSPSGIITTRGIGGISTSSSHCSASSEQQPHPAAITLSGNAPTTICARRSPSTHTPQHAWRSRASGWQAHSAAIIFCGNSPTITNLRQHAVLTTRASLSSAKPRK